MKVSQANNRKTGELFVLLERKNIHDKLTGTAVYKKMDCYCKKYKEVLLYLFFGGLTFLLSIISFILFNLFLGIDELVANILSWILAVLFAFFTNRIWVFKSPTSTVKDFWVQIINFFGGRIVTLIIEESIIYIFITRLQFSSVYVKIVAQVIVIILYYIISKIHVFKGGE